MTPDPAVEELRRVVENELFLKCSFVYANLHEANLGLDSLSEDCGFPVFVFLASGRNQEKTTESGLLIRTIDVNGLMLSSTDEPTTDYSTEDVEPYVNQMRMLCENLIYRLNKSEKTYVLEPIQEFETTKVYERFDRHLFGCGLTFKWVFNTGVSGCYERAY